MCAEGIFWALAAGMLTRVGELRNEGGWNWVSWKNGDLCAVYKMGFQLDLYNGISIGFQLDFNGISMGFQWDFNGISMGFNGIWWDITIWVTIKMLADHCSIAEALLSEMPTKQCKGIGPPKAIWAPKRATTDSNYWDVKDFDGSSY